MHRWFLCALALASCQGGGEGTPAAAAGRVETPRAEVEPRPQKLTVRVVGSGTGTVQSTPAGIECGDTCEATFTAGATVSLAVTPAADSAFLGWAEACSGSASPCAVVLDRPRTAYALFGVPGTKDWLRQVSGEGSDNVHDVAIGQTGDVFVTGKVEGAVTGLGAGFPAGTGMGDVFVSRLAAGDGQPIWAKRFNGGPFEMGFALALDGDGNVLVTGNFTGTLDLGGTPLTSAGNRDIFVAKLAGDSGSTLWARSFGASGPDQGSGVAVTPAGEVLVAGEFLGTMDVGGTALSADGSSPDIFVIRLGADGTVAWAKRFGGPGADEAAAVAVDPSGNAIVTGFFSNSVAFGGATLTSAGRRDAYVVRLDPAGAPVWAKQYGGGEDDEGRDVVVDAAGNAIVAGAYQVAADFGNGPVDSAGQRDAFIVKLSPGGTASWSRRIGAGGTDLALAVAVDSANNVYMTGQFERTIEIDGSTLVSAGDEEMLVLKLSATNGLMAARRLGGPGSDFGRAVSASGGRVVVTGSFAAVAEFAGDALFSAGLSDGFAIALPM